MANESKFTVHMYANEYAFLEWLVLQKPQIETGGDLFGVWQSEERAVVQFVLGPGKQCQRTTTSFHQDVNYLGNVGRHFTSNEGLCNIGEWHSHHHIGLSHPSTGDENTVWGHMSIVSGGRFLMFIANISVYRKVTVSCFMFNSATSKITKGNLELLLNCSPFRHTFARRECFKKDAEHGQDWDTFRMSKLKTGQPKPGNKVGDFETGVEYCVCEIEEMKIGCSARLARTICCICTYLRATLSSIYRAASWCLRFCLAGLVNVIRRCNRRD